MCKDGPYWIERCGALRITLAVLMLGVIMLPLHAQDASAVYSQYAGTVVKVEVLEKSTQAPSSVGTAFYASPTLLVTNYHVVRQAVFQPETYDLQLVLTDGTDLGTVHIVALDPPNDLAVLEVERTHESPLVFATGPTPGGEVLYSMGHPRDLKTSVVEGVFNGTVEASATPLFHFSGSLNPGMSGGPTLKANGEVVGVNVSTAGNQMSFLVPAPAARALMDRAQSAGRPSDEALLAGATQRITEFQASFFSSVISDRLTTKTIGNAALPGGAPGSFDCSADPHDLKGDLYDLVEYRCYVMDELLLGQRGSYNLMYLDHVHMSSDSLSSLAFHELLSDWYGSVQSWEAPENDEATEFACQKGNVADGLPSEMQVAFCIRRHVPHEGMYDLFVRSALLGGDREGVVSTLRATPISFENAMALAERWLTGFSWTQ